MKVIKISQQNKSEQKQNRSKTYQTQKSSKKK